MPDRAGKADGVNNAQILRALRKLAPKSGAYSYVGGLSGFGTALAKGYVASVSVLSSLLPKYLQFGFQGTHQISVILQGGKYYVMNPLAQEGSALLEISAADLQRAAAGLIGDGKVHAVMIKIGVRSYSTGAPLLGPTVLQPPSYRTSYIDGFEAARFYMARHKRQPSGEPSGLL